MRTLESFGEITENYLVQVREMQPDGLYLLAGWPFGESSLRK